MRHALLILAAACAVLAAPAAAAPKPVKLLDAHTHVMIENITPEQEIGLLKRAGIDRVILMHPVPDEIEALAKANPGFVIPSLSIARANVRGTHLDADTGPLLTRLRQSGAVCSFGEVNGSLFADAAKVQGVLAAAAETGAPVNFHIDLAKPETVAAVETALTAYPKMTFVLAHLGWTAGPELIGRLLDAHPNLYTDVSIRFDAPGSLAWRNNGLDLSILAPDETVPPAWRKVMERHPDRFLFAMDINSFGPRYTITYDLVRTARKALAPLPRDLQEAIAHGNAERLLAGCGR